jgi:hypothetical protein
VPVLDLVDDTYLDVPPARLSPLVRDPGRWPLWWPDLDLEVTRDRGDKGVQWAVRPAPGRTLATGPLRRPSVLWTGTAEIWLEPWRERGTVLHHYQRLDPLRPPRLAPAAVDRLRAGRATAWKHHVHRLKDEVERDPDASAGQDRTRGRRSSGG